MALNVEMITFDCDDPDKLADWWARALDGTVNAVAPGFFVTVTRQDGPGLSFQKVDDPTPGKNKVHIDFTAADMEAEVKRLVEIGATETGRGEFGTEFQWVVLADPDGNAFCVAAGG
jgi:predicted enzyme related to lactoylglutathione lyase